MKVLTSLRTLYSHSREWFALLPVFAQLGVVLAFALVVIMVFGLFLESFKASYLVFIDPTQLAQHGDGYLTHIISFILMLIGLVIAGFVISVLNSFLENAFRDIRRGHLLYSGQEHTLIVHYNYLVPTILAELNQHHQHNQKHNHVVILVDSYDLVTEVHDFLKRAHFKHIKVYVRYGDTLSYKTYEDLSITSVSSLLILNNQDKGEPFRQDNHNLMIFNLLLHNNDFSEYIKERQAQIKPVKAIVVNHNTAQFESIVQSASNGLFLSVVPDAIFSTILDTSVLNIDFYHFWTMVLSFSGHKLLFVDPKLYGLAGLTYEEASMRHEAGILVGISRFADQKLQTLLNAHGKTITETDWIIMLVKDNEHIAYAPSVTAAELGDAIPQPKETFIKNLCVVGEERDYNPTSFLDIEASNVHYDNPSEDTLFTKAYYDALLGTEFPNSPEVGYDPVVLNLQDQMLYRIALTLKQFYKPETLKRFVFLVDESMVADHLERAGLRNTILSHVLISKYITQVLHQKTLHTVFAELFQQEGAEFNFIECDSLSPNTMTSLDTLKQTLIHHQMVYVGIVDKDDNVRIEATSLDNARKIIVLSHGEV